MMVWSNSTYKDYFTMTILTKVPETTLPNGKRVFYLRREEVSTLYEVVPEYLNHGVTLQPGDTVFDVGANIGMVSLWLNWKFGGSLDIFAFEPIPAIYAALKLNAERFNPGGIKVFPYGLSQESKTTSFGYNPKLPSMSSAYPDGSKKERDKLKNTILRNFRGASPTVQKLSWVPSFLRSAILDYELKRGFQVEWVTCQTKTLSEVIREHSVERIDWLKVDVEKSELDVLLGIEEKDWPKIKQVSLEVHNLEGRLQQISSLLEKYGLNMITVGQEPLFRGSDVFYLHALRKDQGHDNTRNG